MYSVVKIFYAAKPTQFSIREIHQLIIGALIQSKSNLGANASVNSYKKYHAVRTIKIYVCVWKDFFFIRIIGK